MARPIETPIPKGSRLDQLLMQCKAAGVPPKQAEPAVWKLAIRRVKGNTRLLADWMGTDYHWTRRHLKHLGIFDELAAARGR